MMLPVGNLVGTAGQTGILSVIGFHDAARPTANTLSLCRVIALED
jgi:hypothetical protein